MKNAGKYNKLISFYNITKGKDADGFPVDTETLVLRVWAEVVTTKGYTLIVNNTDFEKAYTKFTIRKPATTVLDRKMIIKYKSKVYAIEYINDIDEEGVELEIQAKEITH